MIDGAYNILFIDYGDGFLPIGCLTSNGISESVDVLDSTTRDSQGWKTQALTNQSYTIDISGIVINTLYDGGDSSKISYDRLKLIKRNRQIISWKIENSINTFIEFGKAQITQISSESNIDEFISFSASLVGYGALVDGDNANPNLGLEEQLEALL